MAGNPLGILVTSLQAPLLLALLLLLHRARWRLGSVPFFLSIGALTVLSQLLASAALLILPGTNLQVRLTSINTLPVLFASMLLVYVLDSTHNARSMLAGTALMAVLTPAVQGLSAWFLQQLGTHSPPPQLDVTVPSASALAVASVALLVFYQDMTNRRWPLWLRPLIALALALWIDTLIFVLLRAPFESSAVSPNLALQLLIGGGAGLLTGVPLYLYLRHQMRAEQIPPEQRSRLAVLRGEDEIQSRLREVEHSYRALFNSTHDGVLLVDADGLLLEANALMFRELRLKPDRLHTVHLMDLLSPEVQTDDLTRIRELASTGGGNLTTRIGQNGGRYMDAELSVTPASYLGRPAALLIVRDVTERNRLLRASRRRTEELSALLSSIRDIASSMDSPSILEAIARRALELLKTDTSILFLIQPNRTHLKPVVALGPDADEMGRLEVPVGNGITGHVALSGEAAIVNRAHLDTASDGASNAQTRPESLLCAPLISKKETIGVMTLSRLGGQAFTEDDLELLMGFADHAAVTIENMRLHEETLQRARAAGLYSRQLEALVETLRSVSGELQLDLLFQQIVERAVEVVPGAQAGSLLIREGDAFRFKGAVGFDLQALKDVALSHSAVRAAQLEAGEVIRRDGVEMMQGVQDLPGGAIDMMHRAGRLGELKANLSAPIILNQRLMGLVNVDNLERENAFDEQAARVLHLFASQAAVALHNAQLFHQARQRAERLAVLNRISQRLAHSLQIDDIAESLYTEIGRLMPNQAFWLGILDEARQQVQFIYNVDQGQRYPSEATPLENTLTELVIRSCQPLLLNSLTPEEIGRSYHFGTPHKTASVVIVPLLLGNRATGAVSTQSYQPDAFTAEDVELLTTAAGYAAVAVRNAQLVTELEARADELARAYENLCRADEIKLQFMQNTSHELRTPLALLLGHAEVLAQGDIGSLTSEQQNSVELIVRRGRQLVSLINDITVMMEMQDMKRPRIRELFSLQTLVRESVEEFELMLRDSEVDLLLQPVPDGGLPEMRGDRKLVRQAFENLLSNALKFTSQGTISVALGSRAGWLWLEVSDTGIGIPASALPRIFERFYQVDGTSRRRYGGTGLGLAVVKEVVEAHSGHVTAASTEGSGTTFTLWFPQDPAQPSPWPATAAAGGHSNHRWVTSST